MSGDPFAAPGETPIWRDGNDPLPPSDIEREPFTPTAWDARLVEEAIAACRDARVRRELEGAPTLEERAMNVLFQQNYYPARFEERSPLYREAHPRAPVLTIPFRRGDYVGISLEPVR